MLQLVGAEELCEGCFVTAYSKFLLGLLGSHSHLHYTITSLLPHFCFLPDFPFIPLILVSFGLNIKIKILTVRFSC